MAIPTNLSIRKCLLTNFHSKVRATSKYNCLQLMYFKKDSIPRKGINYIPKKKRKKEMERRKERKREISKKRNKEVKLYKVTV